MDEIKMKIEGLMSTNSSVVEGSFKCGELTLKLVPKYLCSHCKQERVGGNCCGYYFKSSTPLNVDVQANIKHNCGLKVDLEKALFNENLSDFLFIVEDEKIPVSKIILAARSPVFERMFYSDFKEKNLTEQTIDLPALKTSFKELIRYIYTDNINDLYSNVYNLTYAADYYQVDGLKTVCEEEMHKILTENNANKIFQTAHLYRCNISLIVASFDMIVNIFLKWNLTVPEECVNIPLKVQKLFEKKEALEKELQLSVINVKK